MVPGAVVFPNAAPEGMRRRRTHLTGEEQERVAEALLFFLEEAQNVSVL